MTEGRKFSPVAQAIFDSWVGDPPYLRRRFERILREGGSKALVAEFEKRYRREGGLRWHLRAKMQGGGAPLAVPRDPEGG